MKYSEIDFQQGHDGGNSYSGSFKGGPLRELHLSDLERDDEASTMTELANDQRSFFRKLSDYFVSKNVDDAESLAIQAQVILSRANALACVRDQAPQDLYDSPDITVTPHYTKLSGENSGAVGSDREPTIL